MSLITEHIVCDAPHIGHSEGDPSQCQPPGDLLVAQHPLHVLQLPEARLQGEQLQGRNVTRRDMADTDTLYCLVVTM